mmetsp:Transcript_18782/g.49834  ORF Transcript_18782/g.49834 Transcript_18782/m.49834 type:complete len:82 (+) Transcript_18782:1187-1432(+)
MLVACTAAMTAHEIRRNVGEVAGAVAIARRDWTVTVGRIRANAASFDEKRAAKRSSETTMAGQSGDGESFQPFSPKFRRVK